MIEAKQDRRNNSEKPADTGEVEYLKALFEEAYEDELYYEEDLKMMVYMKLKLNNPKNKDHVYRSYLEKFSSTLKKYYLML